jgi:hypothetical protein
MSKADVTVEGTVKRITRKAWLIDIVKPKKMSIWIPSSQLKDTDCIAENDTGYFVLSHWIAEKNNLVEDET